MIYISFIISITRLVFLTLEMLSEKNKKKRNSILFCLCVMYVINKKKKSVYEFACVFSLSGYTVLRN